MPNDATTPLATLADAATLPGPLHAALAAVSLYVGLNLAILAWLTVKTGLIRQSEKVLIGDGGNQRLIRVMRGHANAMEAIPPTLVAMLVVALLGAPALAIHAFGVLLTVGRFLHALHFAAADAPAWQRGGGFLLSTLAFAGAGLWALAVGVAALL